MVVVQNAPAQLSPKKASGNELVIHKAQAS